MLARNFNEALQHYNTAISMNPTNQIAQNGLLQLERILNPDDDEEDMEEEDVH